jgi:AcrR family transcriptional regulator
VGKPHAPATTDTGRNTRRRILDHAVQRASVHGFESLAFGTLARDLDMSKSGLFAHFRSKEQLQLETYDAAIERFTEHVVTPTINGDPHAASVATLVEHWIAYIERRVFAGGCILTSASIELDHLRGPLRDRVANSGEQWLTFIADLARHDQTEGRLGHHLDPDDIAFQIRAAFLVMNWHYQLYQRPDAFERGRNLVHLVLGNTTERR